MKHAFLLFHQKSAFKTIIIYKKGENKKFSPFCVMACKKTVKSNLRISQPEYYLQLQISAHYNSLIASKSFKSYIIGQNFFFEL